MALPRLLLPWMISRLSVTKVFYQSSHDRIHRGYDRAGIKPQLLEDAQATVDRIAKNFRRGLITEEERYKEVVDTWKTTDDQLTKDLLGGLDKYNNIFMMADSGARGS